MTSSPNFNKEFSNPASNGKAVQIIGLNGREIVFYKDRLEEILFTGDVVDMKIALISVAGPMRLGKSFLLNFFLRYLRHNGAPNWMEAKQALEGFEWRGSCQAVTSGINIWSQPFIVYDSEGENVALFLLDTQGTFDTKTTVACNALIFGLSTLISSVQIYNLTGHLSEDHLQHLHLFVEYGKFAAEKSDNENFSVFQEVLFLVRDWVNPEEHCYGHMGGKRYIKEQLEITSKQAPDMQKLRQYLYKCFNSVNCFLMPEPSKLVRIGKFDLKQQAPNVMGKDFCTHLRDLMPLILHSNNVKAEDGEWSTADMWPTV